MLVYIDWFMFGFDVAMLAGIIRDPSLRGSFWRVIMFGVSAVLALSGEWVR